MATLLGASHSHRLGQTGEDVVVAMVDSGHYLHPFFAAHDYTIRPPVAMVPGTKALTEAKGAAADRLAGDDAEPVLDLVEHEDPTGREMQTHGRVLGQPLLNVGRAVTSLTGTSHAEPFVWTATTDEILAKVLITQTNIKKLVESNQK